MDIFLNYANLFAHCAANGCELGLHWLCGPNPGYVVVLHNSGCWGWMLMQSLNVPWPVYFTLYVLFMDATQRWCPWLLRVASSYWKSFCVLIGLLNNIDDFTHLPVRHRVCFLWNLCVSQISNFFRLRARFTFYICQAKVIQSARF